jgi:iron complex transport system substrate-binding protein
MLFALGLGDQVVAVSHECDYPPEATRKPRATNGLVDPRLLSSAQIDEIVAQSVAEGHRLYHVDLDLLRELQPDLLITQDLCTVCAIDGGEVRLAAGQLEHPPRVLSLGTDSLTELFPSIRQLAEWAEASAAADALIDGLADRLEDVRARAAGLPRPSLVCLEWLDPAWIAGHWMPEVVEAAGGNDALGQAGLPSFRATWTEIANAAPEVLIVMPCGFGMERTLEEIDVLLTVPQVRQLPAFISGQVYVVDSSGFFSRAGPRLIDGLEMLASLLHPQAFPDPVPAGSALRLTRPLGPGTRQQHLEFVPVS